MDERERALTVECPEFREGDGVVAPEQDGKSAVPSDLADAGLDGAEVPVHVQQHDVHVAAVHGGDPLQEVTLFVKVEVTLVPHRVEEAEALGTFPDGPRTEPCPRQVRCSRVVGNAEDSDVRFPLVRQPDRSRLAESHGGGRCCQVTGFSWDSRRMMSTSAGYRPGISSHSANGYSLGTDLMVSGVVRNTSAPSGDTRGWM